MTDLLLPETLQAKRDEPLSNKLRPSSFNEFVGQRSIVSVVSAMMQGAKRDNRPVDHILLYGQPGLGKTTIARIVGRNVMTIKTGGSLRQSADILNMMRTIPAYAEHILLIDEIHSMNKRAQEEIYNLLEDAYVVENGITRQYSKLTIIATTTDKGRLPAPLVDRFGYAGWLEPYSKEEVVEILKRSITMLRLSFTPPKLRDAVLEEIAGRSRGVPRIANKFLKRIADFSSPITEASVQKTFKLLGVDLLGLTPIDRSILTKMLTLFGGGPVGMTTLCLSTGTDEQDFRTTIEPYLLRKGLIGLTPRGRILTGDGHNYVISCLTAQ